MQRLTYEKYRNSENIIMIDLHNGYTVIAISTFDNEKELYITTLLLKDNTMDTWKLIEKADRLEFKTNRNTINSAVLKKVSTLLRDGLFDYYIQRYEYESNCFDIGNDLAERERLGNK